MKASVVDLRYRMAEVLAALDRREKVTVTSHGKVRGTLIPASDSCLIRAAQHPFFGMSRNDDRAVDDIMADLRAGRADVV